MINGTSMMRQQGKYQVESLLLQLQSKMNKSEINKFENYPEGSGGRKIYDMFNMSFQNYLDKYYSNPDLTHWEYINGKFVSPIFDGTNWDEYVSFLNKVKPRFLPNKEKAHSFMQTIVDDNRFDMDIKRFFSFLFSIGFLQDESFEKWIKSKNWANNNQNNSSRTIVEIIKFNYGENYLKDILTNLSIFN